jgi:hypothetical protein
MAFFTDSGVVAQSISKPAVRSHRQAMNLYCVQARLALSKKYSLRTKLVYGL